MSFLPSTGSFHAYSKFHGSELDEGSDDESKEWEEAQIKRASQWERATKVEKNVKRPYKAATSWSLVNLFPIMTIFH